MRTVAFGYSAARHPAVREAGADRGGHRMSEQPPDPGAPESSPDGPPPGPGPTGPPPGFGQPGQPTPPPQPQPPYNPYAQPPGPEPTQPVWQGHQAPEQGWPGASGQPPAESRRGRTWLIVLVVVLL